MFLAISSAAFLAVSNARLLPLFLPLPLAAAAAVVVAEEGDDDKSVVEATGLAGDTDGTVLFAEFALWLGADSGTGAAIVLVDETETLAEFDTGTEAVASIVAAVRVTSDATTLVDVDNEVETRVVDTVDTALGLDDEDASPLVFGSPVDDRCRCGGT